MSNKKLIEKNINLSNYLARYLAKNLKFLEKNPTNASYVILPSDDLELKKENEKLITNLLNKGEKVIKVNAKKDNSKYRFEFVY